MSAEYDASLENLLLLDGETFFVDEDGKYVVKFIVKRVPVTKERPHGLSYSLTLHGGDGSAWSGSITPIK